jgi:iron complex transport system substrate-binding protein
MPRVVSLIASATEIVCALGFERHLVGRSHECDHPESVRELPACTEPKFPVDGTSSEIDQRVKAVLQEALAVYRVDAERLRRLRPEVIVTQSQCEVCAVSLRDVERLACEWLDSRPRIVSLQPNSLADVWSDIGRVAEALGAAERGRELCAALQARMRAIAELSSSAGHRPTVACIEWIEPLMAAGNWMPELVEMAGGVSLFGKAGKHSPWMSWEELRRRDPDVIVAQPCGFDLERTRSEAAALAGLEGWAELSAVRSGRVYVTDGNQYFNRPGPRLAETLEILAELCHPELFDFGHEGEGWQKL